MDLKSEEEENGGRKGSNEAPTKGIIKTSE